MPSLCCLENAELTHKSTVVNEENIVSDMEPRPVLVPYGPSVRAGVSDEHAPFGKSSIRPLPRPVDVRPVDSLGVK